MSDAPHPPLTLEQLPELRRRTEAISAFLKSQLTAHCATLRPVLGPERIFGKLASGKSEVRGADNALKELQERYQPYAGKPYNLPADFNSQWLTLVGNALELQPWTYTHEVDGKAITMTSPVRWIATFQSNYDVVSVKSILRGATTARLDFLRQFVVNALVLDIVFSKTPGLASLFTDLRYELKLVSPNDLGGLPILTITSILDSFRPSDDLITAATAFSGVPEFIELVNVESLRQPRDVLKEQIDRILES